MVYVINKHGKPLMPCSNARARQLLRQGKAKIVKRDIFTIQLLHGSSGYRQDVTLGIDAGSKHVGLSASTGKREVSSGEARSRDGRHEVACGQEGTREGTEKPQDPLPQGEAWWPCRGQEERVVAARRETGDAIAPGHRVGPGKGPSGHPGGDGWGARPIIRRDIEERPENRYWCEASGVIEYLFRKYGGDNIPSSLAHELLGDKEINIVDEYHYERKIGKRKVPCTKTIFGFKDEGIFNRVVEHQRQRLKDTVEYTISLMDEINEATEDEAKKAENEAILACRIIASISDEMDEKRCSDLIPEQVSYLEQSVKALERHPDYRNAEKAISLGRFMLDSYSVLTLRKFNGNGWS